jgi:hypothetical protein
MSTFTTRGDLILPDGSDLITRAVFNANMTQLASLLGVIVCTSLTRPSTPYSGQVLYETDTFKLVLRNAANSAWTSVDSPVIECTSITRPASSFAGQMIYETDTLTIRVRNAANSAWVIAGGISIVSNTSDVTAPYTGQFVFELTSISLKRRSSGGAWVIYPDTSTPQDTQSAVGNTVSTSYVNTLTGGVACGVAFTAPPSGKVWIKNQAWLAVNASPNYSYCTPRVCTGSTVGAGTAIVTAQDTNALIGSSVGYQQAYRETLVQGLTPGNPYNVQQWFKASAGTAYSQQKEVMVEMI